MTKNERPPRETLSAAHEDYLRAIYLLLQRGERATNQAISTELGVAPASATNMVKHLAGLNLVAYTPYQGVSLTAAGEKMALAVVRYHRLLELYLAQALGMPWDKVHGEADRLEHAISADLAEALARALGDPTADPHGDPIPARDGTLPATATRRLADCVAGSRVRLVRVGAQAEDELRRLAGLGLTPGAAVAIRAPADDGLVIEIAGEERRLPAGLAEQLYVENMD